MELSVITDYQTGRKEMFYLTTHYQTGVKLSNYSILEGSSMVRAFAHGAKDHWIDPSWGGPIELFLVPASAPRLV